MTAKEFHNIWSKNINSEYVLTDFYKVTQDNIIIPNSEVLENKKYKNKIYIDGNWYKIKMKKIEKE